MAGKHEKAQAIQLGFDSLPELAAGERRNVVSGTQEISRSPVRRKAKKPAPLPPLLHQGSFEELFAASSEQEKDTGSQAAEPLPEDSTIYTPVARIKRPRRKEADNGLCTQ